MSCLRGFLLTHFTLFDRSEKVWKALGKEGLAVKAPWPKLGTEDKILTRQAKFLAEALKRFRNSATKAKKGWTKASIIVTDEYPEAKVNALKWMQEKYDPKVGFPSTFMKELKGWSMENVKEKKLMSEIMKFVSFTKKEVDEVGVMAMEAQLPFDQTAILTEMKDFIQKQTGISELDIIRVGTEAASAVPDRTIDNSAPGKPCIWFR